MGYPEVVQYQLSDPGCHSHPTSCIEEEMATGDFGLHSGYKEVILALEKGAAAGGADPRRKGQVAREAIDAFILGMVRFQVGSSARFNDLQHTSPSTMKITSNTIEMMAWQTKTASAFRVKKAKKNPVPLIAPKLSLSGVDWWTEWSKTLTLLSSLERFRDMDYLIPTLSNSKDFQGVIPRPSTSDRGLRWLKEALVCQGVEQDLLLLGTLSGSFIIPELCLPTGHSQGPKAILGELADGVHSGYLHQRKEECSGGSGSTTGRTVREDLAHPDWDDKPLDKPGDTESANDSNGLETRTLRPGSLSQREAQTLPVPNILQVQDGHEQRRSHQSCSNHCSRRSLRTRLHLP